MSDWYDKHWYPHETRAFNAWWLGHYGPPEKYPPDYSEQEEYWLRKGFALMGWLAFNQYK